MAEVKEVFEGARLGGDAGTLDMVDAACKGGENMDVRFRGVTGLEARLLVS